MGAEEQAQRIDELAKSKLNMKIGVRRELKKLPERLDENEEVLNLAAGQVGAKRGLIVVTDRRLLFYVAGMVSSHQEEFPYRAISSIEASTGMMSGKLRIFASGNKAEIKDVYPKGAVNEITDFVRGRIGPAVASPPPPPPPPPGPSPQGAGESAADRLRKLQALRDDGLISQDEFDEKRAALISEL